MGFSSLADKVINFTADVMVGIAVHVPFLLTALIHTPNIPFTTDHLKPQPIVQASTAATSVKTNPYAPDPEWEAQYEARTAVKCTGFCIPFDEANWFNPKIEGSRDGVYTFTSSSTKHTVTIKRLNDLAHQGRNAAYDLYVDDVLASESEVGGQSFSEASFSPDGKYFAIRTQYNRGGNRTGVSFFITDLSTLKVSMLSTDNLADTSIVNGNSYIEAWSYVTLYGWMDPDKIAILQYTIGIFPAETKEFRTTPKRVWEFNLLNMPPHLITNRELLLTLPE